MQLGAKILLGGLDEFQRLTNALQSHFMYEERYTDYFFDFPSLPITQSAAVLRLRVPLGPQPDGIGTENFPSLILKEHNEVQCGGQVFGFHQVKKLRTEIVDEILQGRDLLAVLKHYCHAVPDDTDNPFGKIVKELETTATMLDTPQELQQVGSYTTNRRVYRYFSLGDDLVGVAKATRSDAREAALWQSMCIRIDQTDFPFGQSYELEVPDVSVPLDDVVADLESLLQALHIRYSLSLDSKYARFMKYSRGLSAEREEAEGIRLRLAGVEGYKEVFKWLEGIQGAEPHTSLGASQASHHTVSFSQAQTGDASFNGGLVTDLLDRRTQETSSQKLLECSQVTNFTDICLVGRRNHKIANGEQYQENYYFDDVPVGNLMKQRCFLQLRCINNGAAFTLVLKEEQQMLNGSQSGFSRSTEISGDVARLLLCDPTEFLVSQRVHNSIVGILWDDFGMRSLSLIAFFRTHRRTYTRYIKDCMSTMSSLAHAPRQPPTVDDAACTLWDVPATHSTQHTGSTASPLRFNLDCTLYDLSAPARAFAVAAGGNPFCSYSSAAAVSPATHVTRTYEVEVTGLTLENQSVVRHWFTGMLDHLGVEWRSGIQSKLEQYFALFEAPVAKSQPDAHIEGHNLS